MRHIKCSFISAYHLSFTYCFASSRLSGYTVDTGDGIHRELRVGVVLTLAVVTGFSVVAVPASVREEAADRGKGVAD